FVTQAGINRGPALESERVGHTRRQEADRIAARVRQATIQILHPASAGLRIGLGPRAESDAEERSATVGQFLAVIEVDRARPFRREGQRIASEIVLNTQHVIIVWSCRAL